MKTKHTPGPWKVDKWTGLISPQFIAGERNGEACVIAEKLYDESNEPTLEEVEANARLIAAAPELLAALRDLRKEINSHHKMNVKKDFSLMVADAAAVKAIDKAEGGQK